MKSSTIVALVAAAVAALVASLFLGRQNTHGAAAPAASGALVPALEPRLNEVADVEVRSNDGAVTIRRTESGWELAEAAGFPADVAKVRALLVAVSGLQRVEPKTSNPARFGDLGLDEPGAGTDASDRAGTRVRARDGSGAVVADIVLGRTVPSMNFDRPERYARVVGDGGPSFLVRGRIDVDTRVAGWMARDMPTVPRARVSEVVVAHPDGERVHARKDGESWNLVDMPPGRELRWAGAAGSLAGVLDHLAPEGAMPREEFDAAADGAVALLVRTNDGLVVDARTVELDGRTWFVAAAHAEAVAPPLDADDADAEAPAAQPVVDPAIEAEAARWNRLFERFAIEIPSWTAGNLRKRLDELLAPASEPEAEPYGPPALPPGFGDEFLRVGDDADAPLGGEESLPADAEEPVDDGGAG